MIGAREAMVEVALKGTGVRRDLILIVVGAAVLALAVLALPWGWWLLGRSASAA